MAYYCILNLPPYVKLQRRLSIICSIIRTEHSQVCVASQQVHLWWPRTCAFLVESPRNFPEFLWKSCRIACEKWRKLSAGSRASGRCARDGARVNKTGFAEAAARGPAGQGSGHHGGHCCLTTGQWRILACFWLVRPLWGLGFLEISVVETGWRVGNRVLVHNVNFSSDTYLIKINSWFRRKSQKPCSSYQIK